MGACLTFYLVLDDCGAAGDDDNVADFGDERVCADDKGGEGLHERAVLTGRGAGFHPILDVVHWCTRARS